MARKAAGRQEQKRALKKLREKGLYKPKDARAAPTSYGKSLIRKFSDVLSGKATVLNVPKTKKSKGFADARKNADPGVGVYAVKNKLIVPHATGERVAWSKKEKTYRVSRKSSDGTTTYYRKPYGKKIKSPNQLELKPGERIAVPFKRGKRGIEWITFTADEFAEAWAQYRDRYPTLGDELQVVYTKQKFDDDDDGDDDIPFFEREGEFTPTSAGMRKRKKRRRRKI